MIVNSGGNLSEEYFRAYLSLVMNSRNCTLGNAKEFMLETFSKGGLAAYGPVSYASYINAVKKSHGVLKANLKTDPYWAPKYAGAKRVTNVKVAFDPVQSKSDDQMSEVFKDLSVEHPAFDAIIALNEIGVIKGYEDSTFKPERSITRGQAAAMINRELKLAASTEVTFKDVSPDHHFAADIAALNEARILQGYEAGEFGINDKLTRAHLAAFVERAFDLQEQMNGKVASKYHDVPTSHWASEAIHALKTLDQTKVFQTQQFDLGKEATRAEFSAAVFTAISQK